MHELEAHLHRLDGRGYKAYKAIRGRYRGAGFELSVRHVQGDPFAAPSRLEVLVEPEAAGLPADLLSHPARRTGAADAILRAFGRASRDASAREGSGKSGQITCDRPGQEILARSGCEVDPDGAVILRFFVGLPAAGRRVLGRAAARLLCERVPRAVRAAAFDLPSRPHFEAVVSHAHAAEDQQTLRDQLADHGLVAFIADGAILPRASGADDRPMAGDPVPWQGPPELATTLSAPHAGTLSGTGIPAGITLICGGGYHGKSTVLEAISRGIYDHIPRDGRDRVVARNDAMKIRAEDGRRVVGVDISAFISQLPGGRDTCHFTSADASGSTSQAAAVIEALELGASTLLLDEDTCATNFMIRDRRMQELVAPDKEPITPFLDRIRGMRERLGTSVVLVMGGSGDYFDLADTVLVMDAYRPMDATARAHRIAAEVPTGRRPEGEGEFPATAPRVPDPGSLDPSKGRRGARVRARETRTIEFGHETIELAALEQLVDPSQARSIADALLWALEFGVLDGRRPLAEIVAALDARFRDRGPTAWSTQDSGDRAAVRPLEIGAALNRLRSLEIIGG